MKIAATTCEGVTVLAKALNSNTSLVDNFTFKAYQVYYLQSTYNLLPTGSMSGQCAVDFGPNFSVDILGACTFPWTNWSQIQQAITPEQG